MDKIPSPSPQAPQLGPQAEKTKPPMPQSPGKWAQYAISVAKNLISTGTRKLSGAPPKKTAIDKRSIQHITSNDGGRTFTLLKAKWYEKTGQLAQAAQLRDQASKGIYESPPKISQHFRTLGSGGEGRADLVFQGLAGKLEVKKTFFDPENRPETEINLLERLDHPNIIKISPKQSANRSQQGIRMSNGGVPLTGLVPTNTNPARLSPKLFRSVARQLADSLVYLKGEKIQHRDIKPDNIVIDPTGHVTLIDFGMAYDSKTKAACNPAGVGTLRYMPPDGLNHRENQIHVRHSDAADMFAAGQTLFELITGHPLKFPEFRQHPNQTEQQAWNIYKQDLSTLNKIGPAVARSLPGESREHVAAVTHLLQQMLHPDPEQRITPEQLQKLPLLSR